MLRRLRKLKNPFLSIFSTRDLDRKVSELKHEWESFMMNSSNHAQLPTTIRSEILHSWSRCQLFGINPEQKQARTALTTLELKKLLSDSDLYIAAKPIIDNIYHQLIGTGYLITLNDENGKMIYLKGEPEIMRKVEKMNFFPGMDWSEKAAGTNAIGTSIVSKKPIQVFSAEHFCEGFHPMTCSSSPIYHPYTKNVIGAIDFTGLWPSTQPHTLGLAVSLAQMIEQQLTSMYQTKYQLLKEYYQSCLIKWSDQPILVFSDQSVLVNGDTKLLKALNLKKEKSYDNHLKSKKFLQDPENFAANMDEFHFIQLQPIIINQKEIGYAAIFNYKRKHFAETPFHSRDHQIIGESAEMKLILQKCRQISSFDTPVLLTGETGTGKELFAKYIHEESARKEKPFIAINCGAIQKELIGSELFGYESGTFTGGKKEGKKGKFEEANGGTLFLDEIGEMPMDLQVHLLRVLQEKEITRLGASKTIKIDVKVIAATHKNLESMIDEGLFRRDLFFRLNVISFSIPSLRDRKADILPISNYYINLFTKKYQRPSALRLAEKTTNFFFNYTWPGNIRELRNAIEHAVIFCQSAEIEKSHLPNYLADLKTKQTETDQKHPGLSIRERTEMEQIRNLLFQTGWNISAVAKKLKIARSTLYRKLKKYHLQDLGELNN
jgi:transcriptional regulator of acetoin/glycerol metabolism